MRCDACDVCYAGNVTDHHGIGGFSQLRSHPGNVFTLASHRSRISLSVTLSHKSNQLFEIFISPKKWLHLAVNFWSGFQTDSRYERPFLHPLKIPKISLNCFQVPCQYHVTGFSHSRDARSCQVITSWTCWIRTQELTHSFTLPSTIDGFPASVSHGPELRSALHGSTKAWMTRQVSYPPILAGIDHWSLFPNLTHETKHPTIKIWYVDITWMLY